MAPGVAFVTLATGNLVLPARTLYDRQVLADHVRSYARRGQPMRVRVDDVRWTVASTQDTRLCQACGRSVARAVCYRPGHPGSSYCVTCALTQPRLTIALLEQLPVNACLEDVQARYVYGRELVAWTRWPRATPREIIADIRLQRRFAPVLTWTCKEIRFPPANVSPAAGVRVHRSA